MAHLYVKHLTFTDIAQFIYELRELLTIPSYSLFFEPWEHIYDVDRLIYNLKYFDEFSIENQLCMSALLNLMVLMEVHMYRHLSRVYQVEKFLIQWLSRPRILFKTSKAYIRRNFPNYYKMATFPYKS